ncbi:MAG: CsbD family protein [Cyclobacteriaceae bacterium]
MNLELHGNWNILKGKLKQKYGELTDDDLVLAEGEEDKLIGNLQKKLNKSKTEILAELNDLITSNK